MPESRTVTAEPAAAEEVEGMFTPPAATDLVHAMPRVFEKDYEPVWKRLSDPQKQLLRSKSGQEITDVELGQGVELAATYGLDPFANEIWFTKSKPKAGRNGQMYPGRLLIMVGRDGLRKIAQRNGLEMPCSAIYEKDDFSVEYVTSPEMLAVALTSHGAPVPADLERAFNALGGGHPFHFVWHVKRGIGTKARGPLVGAWARTYERSTNIERGYFDAPLEEYEPGGDYDSPWRKQKSVMMLSAVERQAARQGTPLGGLLAEGEDEVIDATAVEVTPAKIVLSPELQEIVDAVVARAKAVGHAAWSNPVNVEMLLDGQPDDVARAWQKTAMVELDRVEQAKAQAPAIEAAPDDLPLVAPDVPPDVDGALADLEQRLEAARQEGNEPLVEDLLGEKEALEEAREQGHAD